MSKTSVWVGAGEFVVAGQIVGPYSCDEGAILLVNVGEEANLLWSQDHGGRED